MLRVFKGFRDFILRGNAVDLAVGVVIGASFGTLVAAIVKDLLTPLIGAVAKVPNFSGLSFTLNGSRFMYGELINASISFFLVAVAIYFFVVIPMNTFSSKIGKKNSVLKKCPECLSEIPAKARRCSHCAQLILYNK